MRPQVPKRIIQTGKNRNLPLQQRAAAASVKLLNPDFEYLFFDDEQVEDFVVREFPEHRIVFHSFRFPIQRFDFFRYLAVYRYGGFYFDLDVFLAEGLVSLLDSGCVFSFERLNKNRFLRDTYGMDWDIGNYAFGATTGHPFLRTVIENCLRAQRDPDWVRPMMRGIPQHSRDDFYILNTTGPGLLSRTLAENAALAEMVTVLFPRDACDSHSWHCFGDLGFHLMEGSWRKQQGFLRRRLVKFWERRASRSFLRESAELGKSRNSALNPFLSRIGATPASAARTRSFAAPRWMPFGSGPQPLPRARK